MIGTASAERVLLLAIVARHGSMTAAAEEIGYSVSAISQQLRKLEAEAGQPLLRRHSRGILLTDAGQAVVHHAEQIGGQLRSLQYSLDDIAGLRAGTLKMGTFPTVGASLLPIAISRFRRQQPGIDLTVRSLRRDGLLAMLGSRDISMSLLWDYQWARLELPEFEVTPLMEDPAEVVLAATHPLAERDTVTIAELVDEPWVVRAENHPMSEIIIRTADRTGYAPKVAYEANDYQEVQAMVAVGMGVSLVPRLALAVLRSDVRVVPLSGNVPRRRILLARVRDGAPTAAEEAMRRLLVDAAEELADIPPNQPIR